MVRKMRNKFLGISDLSPIKDWHTNSVLKGLKKGEIVVFPDIPVTQLGDKVISVWKAPSIWSRFKFLLTGKVNFQILAPTHAPIAISVGEYERTEKEDENGED